MATIIITGGNGQLGRAIADAGAGMHHHRFIFTDVDELNICDESSLADFITSAGADFLINCAAYTAVDLAEDEPEKAYDLNSTAVKNMAVLCAKSKTRLIHISTDYVFSGTSSTPYREDSLTGPGSVYGQSKLDGEIAVMYNSKDAIIIRTSWLYYHGGKNFVNTIMARAAEKKPLKVVYDQIGAPTYALDLADAILKIIDSERIPDTTEIFHFCNSGVISWYDFAKAITEIMDIEASIKPILTSEIQQRATRPDYSVLNCARISETFGIEIPYWRDSLIKYLAKT